MSDDARFTAHRTSRAARRAQQAAADQAVVETLSQAARDVAATEPSGPSPAAWHRLARTRAEAPRTVSRTLAWAAVGMVACAAVLVTVQIVRHVRSAPLTYAVQGGVMGAGGQVEAVGAETAVRFSDGTEIELEPKARLVVNAAGPHGARLRLQSGQAHFRVMHLPRAAWAVAAGPYLVEVTGTEFDVRWSESEQMAEVKMHTGSVRVSGPLLSERVALGKGQHLLARLGAGEVRIDDGRLATAPTPSRGDDARAAAAPGVVAGPQVVPAPVPEVAPVAAAPAEPEKSREPSPSDVRPAARPRPRVRQRLALANASVSPVAEVGTVDAPAPAPAVEPPPQIVAPAVVTPPRWSDRDWTARVASGAAPDVVADAERLGLDKTMHDADGADLAALADAARYARRPELAERALLTTRRRFSSSAHAHAAAFLLGRMADDRGDARTGLAWYRAYLGEAPAGPYAAEALGRAMLIVVKLQGREAAVPIAEDYLGRFPNGTYLLQARALIDNR